MTQTRNTHLALYRKYRPQTFDDVRGQGHITDVLKSVIKQGKVSHAYLFSGTRGTGKTTVARILAREIGCTNKDLYEIDGASNRGIDDIREIRDGVHISPFESKYKVYIIDEVHMLTKEAFNALLKTLEEPPSHVVFMFATTELHKVPDTIQSRCEVYNFTQPSREIIANEVEKVAKKEGFKFEKSASDLIALLAEGSFRDALGILQKVLIVSKDKKVDVSEVESVTGAPKEKLIRDVIKALSDNNSEDALEVIQSAVKENIDMSIFAKLIISKIRAVLLLKHAPDLKKRIEEDLSKEDFDFVEDLSIDKASKISANTLRTFLEAYSIMNHAAIPHIPLELAIMDLCVGADKSE